MQAAMNSVPAKTQVTRAAGFVIFRVLSRTIEYLLLQTSYGNHHWTPPKGHVDPGENDRQTALRETLEESGLDKSHLCVYDEYMKEINYNVKGKPKAVVYFLAELINPDTSVRLSDEHQDYKWLTLDKACELAQYVEMQQVLNDCHAFIRKIKNVCDCLN